MKCAHGHELTPENTILRKDGYRRCRMCQRRSNLEYKRSERARAYRRSLSSAPEPDGWEDEFGPVPPRVPDTAWVDWVAVQRFVRGEDVGRDLTKGEHRALHLLEVIRAGVPELESAV